MDNHPLHHSPAEQLLNEIHSESLQEFLFSLRQEIYSRPLLWIPSLHSCATSEVTLTRDSLGYGRTIEIHGYSGSGKTHLLYFLLATCILPFEHLATFVGGRRKAAFVIDMDGHFRISRFREILMARLRGNLPPLAIPSNVQNYLRCLHVFRPTSTDQLAVTLKYLPKYHTKFFPDFELGMVAIHSTDAFYWLDRFKAEQVRSVPASEKAGISRHILTSLQDILLSGDTTLVMTHGGLPKTNQQDYTTESNIHIQPEVGTVKPYPESASPLRIECLSRHQMSLNLQTLETDPTVEDSQIQGIRGLVRTPDRDDPTSFNFYINQHGMKIGSS